MMTKTPLARARAHAGGPVWGVCAVRVVHGVVVEVVVVVVVVVLMVVVLEQSKQGKRPPFRVWI